MGMPGGSLNCLPMLESHSVLPVGCKPHLHVAAQLDVDESIIYKSGHGRVEVRRGGGRVDEPIEPIGCAPYAGTWTPIVIPCDSRLRDLSLATVLPLYF